MFENVKFDNVSVVGKGSVYGIKSGKQNLGLAFYYKVNDEEKKRKTIAGNSEEELEKKALAFLQKIQNEYVDNKQKVGEIIQEVQEKQELQEKTFVQVGEMWFAEYKDRRNNKKKAISYSSVESRYYALKKMYKFFGDMLIQDITNETAENLLEWASVKDDGTYYSVSHVDKLQQTFQLVMKYGKSKGYCINDIELIELDDNLTKVDTDARFLDRKQLSELLDVVKDNPRYWTLLKLLISTGMRQEEALALHVEDFYVKDNYVEITINKTIVEVDERVYDEIDKTKSDRSKRKIMIPHDMYEIVMQYYNEVIENETVQEQKMREKNGTVGMIFVDKYKKEINKRTLARSLKNYIERRKGKDYRFTLHMTRHSYASLQAENLPAHQVAKLLGDTQKTVEDNYYSLSDNAKEEITQNVISILDSIDNI